MHFGNGTDGYRASVLSRKFDTMHLSPWHGTIMALRKMKKFLVPHSVHCLLPLNQDFFWQNLALSDLLFVTICIPPTAVDYAIGWPFGLGVCRVVQYLVHVSTYREARQDSETHDTY